jgi:16S rRNA (uracil1498-N3)-methyltransferase
MQLVIGAEGGFTTGELDAAHAAGATLVGLGPRILRAETAALVAVALCQARWGDLHATASDADR